MLDDVPPEHQAAAEEVRAHLVALRGGAPFLSPKDAVLLVRWLDAAVPVPLILQALERAALARRATPSRLPLSLGQAKRHLDATRRTARAPTTAASGLGALAQELRTLARGHAWQAAIEDLATAISALSDPDPDGLARSAMSLVRAFFTARWEALTEEERAATLRDAHSLLADALADLPEDDALKVVEEVARDGLRQQLPSLTAAAIWEHACR